MSDPATVMYTLIPREFYLGYGEPWPSWAAFDEAGNSVHWVDFVVPACDHYYVIFERHGVYSCYLIAWEEKLGDYGGWYFKKVC